MTYNEEGQQVNDLAESVEMSEDGLTYTVTLKDDLKWSNGDPLDANDFVYSWNRAANPMTASDYGYMFAPIKGYAEMTEMDDDGNLVNHRRDAGRYGFRRRQDADDQPRVPLRVLQGPPRVPDLLPGSPGFR